MRLKRNFENLFLDIGAVILGWFEWYHDRWQVYPVIITLFTYSVILLIAVAIGLAMR